MEFIGAIGLDLSRSAGAKERLRKKMTAGAEKCGGSGRRAEGRGGALTHPPERRRLII
jgi:hypothetical protein